jgi:DNA transposition AAA+ family ATPase
MAEGDRLYSSVATLQTVTRLLALIGRCEDRTPGLPGMACFYGPAGFGKTTAAIYAANRLNAVHVEAKSLGGLKMLLEAMVVELGLRPVGSAGRLFKQVVEELIRTGRPLIIDEADRLLRDVPIETIRDIHEASGAPVILMGEESLPHKLTRWPRVHGRMLAWVEAEPATVADVGQLAAIYAAGIEVAPDLRARVADSSRGSLRYISTNLALIREEALRRGVTRMTAADWGGTALHTGEPPAIRRTAPLVAAPRRGAA